MKIGSAKFDTTGVLGVSAKPMAQSSSAAFRDGHAARLASLSLGRRWHFFFAWLFAANLVVYYIGGLASGHLRRDLLPSRAQLRPKAILKRFRRSFAA